MEVQRPLVPMLIAELESVPLAPWLPWVVAGVLSAGFWIGESVIHSVFFEQSLTRGLLSPDPHELWMRVIVIAMLTIAAVFWTMGLSRHREYLARAHEHQDQLAVATQRYAYGDAEDRRELADRLHENVGQTLAAARMFLSSVDFAGCSQVERDVVTTVGRALDRSIADCRDIAMELSPPVLDEYGLEPALEALARRLTQRTETPVEIHLDPDALPLTREVLLTAFGVLAEVIEGAAADPATSGVSVAAKWTEKSVSVTVTWDANTTNDYCVAGHRMAAVGGRVNRYHSQYGSTVVVEAPIGPAV